MPRHAASASSRLEDGLAADERFLAALESRQQLHRRQEPQDLPPTLHSQVPHRLLDATSRRDDSNRKDITETGIDRQEIRQHS